VTVTTHDVVIAILFTIVGWLAHMGWQELCDAVWHATGRAGGLIGDLFALIGVVAVCFVIGWWFTH